MICCCVEEQAPPADAGTEVLFTGNIALLPVLGRPLAVALLFSWLDDCAGRETGPLDAG